MPFGSKGWVGMGIGVLGGGGEAQKKLFGKKSLNGLIQPEKI